MKQYFKIIWEKWKKFAHIIGKFNTKLFVTIFYFLIISPVGLLFRLFGWDPLDNSFKKEEISSNWKPVKTEEPDLDSMSRQS